MTHRILFIDRLPPYRPNDGSCRVIWSLGGELARQGWDVHYFCPNADERESRPGRIVHTIRVPGSDYSASYTFLVLGTPVLMTLIRKLKPDLIYDNATPMPFLPLYLFHRRRMVTRVHQINFQENFRMKRGLLNPVVSWSAEQVLRFMDPARIVVNGPEVSKRLQRINPRGRESQIISPGIDLSSLPLLDPARPRTPGMVLALTRLAANKGLTDLLEAWGTVEREDATAVLKIAGTGPEESRLRRLVAELRLERVEFLGYVTDERKWALLSQCSVWVFPTLGEGIPVGVLEAMALRAPIVSTRSTGVTDLIEHNRNGILVPPGNSAELASGMLVLLRDRGRAERLAAEARLDVLERDLANVNRQEIAYLEARIHEGARAAMPGSSA